MSLTAAAAAAAGVGAASKAASPFLNSLGHFIDTKTDLKYGYQLAYNDARAEKDSELYLLDQMKARGVNPYAEYLSPVSASASGGSMSQTGTRQPASSKADLDNAIKVISENFGISSEEVVKLFRSLNKKYNM